MMVILRRDEMERTFQEEMRDHARMIARRNRRTRTTRR
jgi:hypothetical protein